jgi:hypothetical protein
MGLHLARDTKRSPRTLALTRIRARGAVEKGGHRPIQDTDRDPSRPYRREREGYARSRATTSSSRSVGLLWIMGGPTSASSSEEYAQSSESI